MIWQKTQWKWEEYSVLSGYTPGSLASKQLSNDKRSRKSCTEAAGLNLTPDCYHWPKCSIQIESSRLWGAWLVGCKAHLFLTSTNTVAYLPISLRLSAWHHLWCCMIKLLKVTSETEKSPLELISGCLLVHGTRPFLLHLTCKSTLGREKRDLVRVCCYNLEGSGPRSTPWPSHVTARRRKWQWLSEMGCLYVHPWIGVGGVLPIIFVTFTIP